MIYRLRDSHEGQCILAAVSEKMSRADSRASRVAADQREPTARSLVEESRSRRVSQGVSRIARLHFCVEYLRDLRAHRAKLRSIDLRESVWLARPLPLYVRA